jgi:pimeloyl-ACP methyl ester carboxylesterase
VTFDLRGHGNSDKPDHAAAYASGEQWADDLHTVMEAAGLRRPTLVGWSLGGAIIGLYLAKYGRESTAGINLVDALTEKKIEGGVDVAVTPCR